mgnify:CR=1 FL=1
MGIELTRVLSGKHEVVEAYNSFEIQGGHRVDVTDFLVLRTSS